MPPDVAQILSALGSKPRKAELRTAILRLAELRPYRSVELAELLGLSDVAKLVQRHLSAMVAEGLLERTHPENWAHPAQSYQASRNSRE